MSEASEKTAVTDLLYPSAEARSRLNKRRIELNEKMPCTFIDDLMTETVASMICRKNPQNVMRLFREMNTDPETAEYRLDALEDIINHPKLSPVMHNIIRTLLESERKNIRGMGSPDTFQALSAVIDGLDTYIGCMEELHSFRLSDGERIKSAAFKKMFGDFEKQYFSEDFASMKRDISELKEAFSKRVRSVTVAINFDGEMRPVSAGIVGYSDKPAGEKPSVFDRLFYKNSAKPDTYVMGKLRSKEPNEDGFVSEADHALFMEMEKITSGYMGRLTSALKAYDRLSFEHISALEDQMDIYDGLAKLVDSAQARGLKMCRPKLCTDSRRYADIKKLYDPCFFFKAAAADHEAKGDDLTVRNDIVMDDSSRFFILTGANNGGKTTFTRAVGLCFLMAQTGFYVPAEYCELSVCDFIYTHFPREEETGINSSRFTTEIKQFKTISNTITENSLLLMNESIQSTTPKECCDIASELVKIFCIIGTRGIFATHLTELAYLCDDIAADPDCKSVPASIVATVDEASGKRLYKIKRGMPLKQSYASDIFRSFGISLEEVRKRTGNTHTEK
ncbi:MAG: DNA mismatch repair protein MutS [Huintestinicola sp.]